MTVFRLLGKVQNIKEQFSKEKNLNNFEETFIKQTTFSK
jgi:hypothetical protein